MSTEIQPTQKRELTIRDRLESQDFRAAVAKALPKHLTPDRFVRVACTCIMRTPKLAQCDQTSFFNALLTLSQLGIEPDGRRAHLIPFENRKRNVTEVQLIVDYKGLVELVMRSGMVSNIHADIVCDADDFEFDRGELKKHRINFREPRGKVYAAYCIVRFKDGSEKCDVMTSEEIESTRSRSRAGQAGPWVTDWAEMAKKTVFRRLSKWLPLSPEFRDAIEADEDTAIDISGSPSQAFQVEVPKSKPALGRPKKEKPTEPEVPAELKPDPSDLTSTTAPLTPDAEDLATAKAEDDGGLGPQPRYEISPALVSKLTELKVSWQSFDRWVEASGRAESFNADFEAASAKLLSEERSLKLLQKFHVMNGTE